jgi:hypothetical protein
MKALVSNTAKDNGNPGPDYKYGFGNLTLRAIKVLDNKMFIRPLLLMERLMKRNYCTGWFENFKSDACIF